MYAKIEITGVIEVVTGMHIGGTSEFSAIGAIDSPVVRDALTQLPMIPGSSLKGKMRSLLSRSKSDNYMPIEIKDEPESVMRLFGFSGDTNFKRGRLQFSDMFLSNRDQLFARGARNETEVKFENTINRLTAVANPRQIERVIRGSEFDFSIMYNVSECSEIEEDFSNIAKAMKLLECDYLGGNGSRGYGKIKFKDMEACCVIGEISDEITEKCEKILNGV